MTDETGAGTQVTPAENKPKKGGGGNIAAIIVVLLLIVGIAYYFFTKKPVQKAGGAAEIFPEKSVFFLHVDYNKIDDKDLKADIEKQMNELSKSNKNTGLDYEKDVKPWFGGELSMAMFSIPKDKNVAANPNPQENTNPSASSKEEPQFAVVLSVKNMEQAKTTVKNAMDKEKDKVKYTEEKYENNVVYTPDKKGFPVMSFIKDQLVLAGTVNDMHKVIDISNGKEKPLSSNDEFREAIGQLQRSFGEMYMDLGTIVEEQQKSGNQQKQDPETEKFVKAMRGFAVGLDVKNGDGMLSGFMGFDKKTDSKIVKLIMDGKSNIGRSDILKLFPKDMSLCTAGDPKMLTDILMTFGEAQEGGKENIDQMKNAVNTGLGIDFDKDFVQNLGNEYAYAIDFDQMIQGFMGGGRGQSFPFVITIKFKDKAKLTDAVNKVTTKLGDQVVQDKKENATIYVIPKNSIAFAVMDDYLVIGVGAAAKNVETIVLRNAKAEDSLSSLKGYKQIESRLGAKTLSVSVIQLEKLIPTVKMIAAMASSQGTPEQAQAVNQIIEKVQQYNEIWTFSEQGDGGIRFTVNVLKIEDKNKK